MKIVDHKTFMAMPPDTLFSKWRPCCFDELTIKGDSISCDFFAQDIASAIEPFGLESLSETCDRSAETGEQISIDLECQGRDGCFDDEQMFAVWEAADVVKLIERLQKCLPEETP